MPRVWTCCWCGTTLPVRKDGRLPYHEHGQDKRGRAVSCQGSADKVGQLKPGMARQRRRRAS